MFYTCVSVEEKVGLLPPSEIYFKLTQIRSLRLQLRPLCLQTLNSFLNAVADGFLLRHFQLYTHDVSVLFHQGRLGLCFGLHDACVVAEEVHLQDEGCAC